jgi:hypothetical protein
MAGLLDRHGTKAFAIPPSAIAAAAEADLRLRQRKLDGKERFCVPYCFHRRHVCKANCALDLVDRALQELEVGLGSNKRATQLIYGDEQLLRAARAALSPTARDRAA